MSCSCVTQVTHSCLHPSLLQTENTVTGFLFLNFPNWKHDSIYKWTEKPVVLLTPGLWSALSCRPKRLPPWPPCRGEAVAEDSRLGDWAIMGELGVEVRAPVSVRRCSSRCLCCCSIWHTTTCCSWWRGRASLWGVQDTWELGKVLPLNRNYLHCVTVPDWFQLVPTPNKNVHYFASQMGKWMMVVMLLLKRTPDS